MSAQTHCRGQKWVKRASEQVRIYGGTDRLPSPWQAAGISYTCSTTLDNLCCLRKCVGLCWAHMLTAYWPWALRGASTASSMWKTEFGQREWGDRADLKIMVANSVALYLLSLYQEGQEYHSSLKHCNMDVHFLR